MKQEKQQNELLSHLQKEISETDNDIEKIEFVEQLSHHDFQGEQSGLAEYKITTKDNEIGVCGFFSSDKKSKRFYNKKIILEKLEEYNFPTDDLSTTKILYFFPKTNIFLREKVQGESLLKMIETQNQDYKKVVQSSARWLKRMHGLKPEKNIFQSRYKIAKKNYKDYLKSIKKHLPEKTTTVENILNDVQKLSKKQPETHLVHGDFQAQNIIYNQEDNKTTVIDYDWAGVGDHLYDIASFLIQTDYKVYKLLSENEIIKAKNLFLEAYEYSTSNNSTQRINAYQAEIAIQRINWIIGFIDNPPANFELNKQEQKETMINLIQKAEECLKDNENINLKLFNYSTL